MKIYCQNCGKPTEYTALNKPNFCFNCGAPFAGGVSVASVNQVSQSPSPTALDNDSDEISEVPDINKLEVDINVQEVQAIKMENLAGTSQDGFSEPPRTVDGQSSEELINSFMKEASSLKRSD